jgi:hypothetical protein
MWRHKKPQTAIHTRWRPCNLGSEGKLRRTPYPPWTSGEVVAVLGASPAAAILGTSFSTTHSSGGGGERWRGKRATRVVAKISPEPSQRERGA